MNGDHLLRHVHNAAMPLDGRLRMLNAYFNRADSTDDLAQRRAAVADAGLPETEVERLYQRRGDTFARREA